jgi:transcriptional regulator with XRE-family HTH domain
MLVRSVGGNNQAMASALSLYLKAEIERRGWSDADLADRSNLSRPTLSKLLNNPGQIPELDTLSKLAVGLGVDLTKLVTLCGFPASSDPVSSRGEQMAILLETVPELQGFLDVLARLRPDDIRAIRAYADGMARRRDS